MRRSALSFYIFFTSSIFILRTIFFAFNFGAVEHDSGWFVGVARNLAQRGIYASYTNTIKIEGIGSHPSIHGRYSVQDSQGFSYFPAGVTSGPGYVIPQAMIFKLFGFGFWQIRGWPLAAFFLMLIFLFLLTYQLGGFIALLILQVWMWVIPQLYITFSYEAFGEHIALLYLLVSFFLLSVYSRFKSKKLIFFTSGLLFSLSILTKYLTFLAGGGVLAFALLDLYTNKKSLKNSFQYWTCFILGIFLPIGLFEFFRYINLTTLFDKSAWQATNMDFLLHFKSNGSGAGLYDLDWDFVSKKLTVWTKVGITYFLLPWTAFIGSSFIHFKQKIKVKKALFLLIFASSLSVFLWYLFVSSTGWSRHAWIGLMLAMVVISGVLGKIFELRKKFGLFIYVVLIVLIGLVTFSSRGLHPKFLLDREDIESWRIVRYQGGIQGLPHTDTFSLADQKDLIYFFSQNIKGEDRVYYLGWFLVAEASPLVDKVFYSLDRYLEIRQAESPEGGKSYLIIGPYQKGKYSLVPKSYYPLKLSQLCEAVVFENSSYTLCSLKNNLMYENRAYD